MIESLFLLSYIDRRFGCRPKDAIGAILLISRPVIDESEDMHSKSYLGLIVS